MEYLQAHTRLPVPQDSHVKFTLQSINEMYPNFQSALYREGGDPLRFSYPSDHPLAAEFEEQMTALFREYKGDGEYLSVHHPDTPGALDDAPDATALMLMGAARGAVGDILFVQGKHHGEKAGTTATRTTCAATRCSEEASGPEGEGPGYASRVDHSNAKSTWETLAQDYLSRSFGANSPNTAAVMDVGRYRYMPAEKEEDQQKDRAKDMEERLAHVDALIELVEGDMAMQGAPVQSGPRPGGKKVFSFMATTNVPSTRRPDSSKS